MKSAKSSGEQTSSACVNAGPALLCGAHVITNGTNDGTLIIKNALTDTGTVVAEIVCHADNEFTKYVPFAVPIDMNTGIYGKVSGTGASFILEFIPLG